MTAKLKRYPRLAWTITGALIAIPPIMGLYALWLGQDASWDLRNYHFYNPFAYLTGRMGYDIAVAHVATYYNPLMYIPFYYAVCAFPPKVIGFVLGLIPGCNIFLLYAIARRATQARQTRGGCWLCLAVALTGFFGAVNLSEIGTSFGDNILSLLVLAAVWLIISQRRRFEEDIRPGALVAVAAGALAGAAFGLKQPFAVYAVGLCAAFFGLGISFRRRFLLAFVFGLGVLAGAAATGGFWMIEMWDRYQNPLFPYFNQLFQSPWGAPAPYRDERFLPQDATDWLMFPFRPVRYPTGLGEVFFRDLRFPLLYLLAAGLLIKRALSRIRGTGAPGPQATPDDPGAVRPFILIFMAVSFILWMKLFGVYRYVIVLELLAPLAILLVWGALVRRTGFRTILAAACFVLILATLVPGDWDRRPWGPDYFGVASEVPPVPGDSLVLGAGFEPMAYMIPFFPPQVRFLRIQGYMTGPSSTPNETDRLMRGTIDAHRGPLYILFRSFDVENVLGALSAYGLEISGNCRELTPHVEPQQEHPFYLCTVRKRSS